MASSMSSKTAPLSLRPQGRPYSCHRPAQPEPPRALLSSRSRPNLLPAAPRAAPRRLLAACSSSASSATASSSSHPAAAAAAAASRQPQHVLQVDYLVLGSGIAGLTYALKVAPYGRVAIVTKDQAHEGCTQYAQGGVCAVLDATDSVEDHVRDTVVAGAFLNDMRAVEAVCREGPARVMELVQLGADFTRNADGSLHLTKEGGHNNRRIVHATDMTGREIERALLQRVADHPAITMYEHHLAIDLVVANHAGTPHCFGADVLDQRTRTRTRFVAHSTMLATGGAGQVYPNTTNPHVATGDGIAMAYRANAAVSNMEFVQFHPTALYLPPTAPADDAAAPLAAAAPDGGVLGPPPPAVAQTFLITEALRGEGAILRNLGGERFMERYDPERMELAPRDVVARAIHDQMLTRGEPHVWLDISHHPAAEVLHHFPNIAARCLEHGIDITAGPIPVVPAQHYTCGGVQTGLLGETGIQGLYACGEVACSGLHGANRLASNSLLEGLVFADRAVNSSVAHAEHAALSCRRQLQAAVDGAPRNVGGGGAADGNVGSLALSAQAASEELEAWAAARRAALREAMWRRCGIVRRTGELRAALDMIRALRAEVEAVAAVCAPYTCIVELRNLSTCAELIVACALQRKESRGLHYVVEYPKLVEEECRPSMLVLSGRKYSRGVSVGGGGVGAASTGGKPGLAGVVLNNAVVARSSAVAAKKRGAAAVPRGEVAVRSVDV